VQVSRLREGEQKVTHWHGSRIVGNPTVCDNDVSSNIVKTPQVFQQPGYKKSWGGSYTDALTDRTVRHDNILPLHTVVQVPEMTIY
jgi:hypothetical protein